MSLGESNPDRLLAKISGRRFAEWVAYSRLEPFGPPALFWQAGMIASVLANIHRDKNKRPKPFAPEDFMPASMVESHEEAPEDVSAKVLQTFRALAELHSGVAKR